jgi:methionyl-tRNA formyltransferase
MKIAFFGTSSFGESTLKELHKQYGVEFVVTGLAKPANRGKKVVNTPIFECANSLGISRIYTPEKLTHEFEEYLQDIDYAVVVAYGKILPERILKAVKSKFINLHPSSLPLFRGAAPIERTLEEGCNETSVCVINMQKELDAGEILAKEEYKILKSDNSVILHEKFSKIGASLIVNLIKNGIKNLEIQDHSKVTYARKILKQELELQLVSELSANQVINKIRAFASYGYCFVFWENKRFKILEAKISNIQLTPIDIKCIDGLVSPLLIRPEGKGDIKISDYQF